MDEVKSSAVGEISSLTEQEKKVIAILREIKHGELRLVVQDGVPVRVNEIRKSIKI